MLGLGAIAKSLGSVFWSLVHPLISGWLKAVVNLQVLLYLLSDVLHAYDI